jgi:hypothetical protein
VIQVALLWVIPDFRAALYLNAGLLSAAAASAIILARSVRGWSSVVDVVLPLSILTLGQWECLLVGFALNLMMTSLISWRLISIVGLSTKLPGWWPCLRIGGLLVVLPLCGGSGIAMLPPLVLWLACHVAWGLWSGRDPGPSGRAICLGLLMTTSAIMTWYLSGYVRSTHIPTAPSTLAIWLTTLQVFSLVISPIEWGCWQVAGPAVVLLSAATVILLAIVVRQSPDQRPRAFGLIALLLSIFCVAVLVGFSRSGLSPVAGLSSRYIPLSAPLLGVVYFAWMLYGATPARRVIHISLLSIVCAGIPAQVRFARAMGEGRRDLYVSIERGIKRGMTPSKLLDLTYPALYVDRVAISKSFQMLKDARVGKFRNMSDDSLAIKEDIQTRRR